MFFPSIRPPSKPTPLLPRHGRGDWAAGEGLSMKARPMSRDCLFVERRSYCQEAVRENHKSKHISSPTPFYFCLGVWASAWPRFDRVDRPPWQRQPGEINLQVHCHFTLSWSWLHFFLPFPSLPFPPKVSDQKSMCLLYFLSVQWWGVWMSTELSGESWEPVFLEYASTHWRVCRSALLLFLQGLSYPLSHASPALGPTLRDAGNFSS